MNEQQAVFRSRHDWSIALREVVILTVRRRSCEHPLSRDGIRTKVPPVELRVMHVLERQL